MKRLGLRKHGNRAILGAVHELSRIYKVDGQT